MQHPDPITELLEEETSSLFTLESFQQFLIDYKLKVDGQDYEVATHSSIPFTQMKLQLFFKLLSTS